MRFLLNIFSIFEKILILKKHKRKNVLKKTFFTKNIVEKYIIFEKKCFYLFDAGRQFGFILVVVW